MFVCFFLEGFTSVTRAILNLFKNTRQGLCSKCCLGKDVVAEAGYRFLKSVTFKNISFFLMETFHSEPGLCFLNCASLLPALFCSFPFFSPAVRKIYCKEDNFISKVETAEIVIMPETHYLLFTNLTSLPC